MSWLSVERVSCAYQGKTVVEDLNFRVEQGAIACLLGPSGSGKTTVLRALAGFEPVYSGEIKLGDRVIARPNAQIPPHERNIGLVFQDYALFPHLTVSENIGFGITRAHRKTRVRHLAEMMGLEMLLDRYPHQLSGGQQQRVALARALGPKPDLLLLDEPFSNLDIELRERLGNQVRNWIKDEGLTAILVTHDQHEAFAMADEIGVVHERRLQQWSAPYQLYHQPETRFVADFIGEGVFLPGVVDAQGHIAIELGDIGASRGLPAGTRLEILVRPDDVIHDDLSPLKGKIKQRAFRGAQFLYTIELDSGADVLSLVPSHHNHAVGEPIGIRLNIDHVIAFPR